MCTDFNKGITGDPEDLKERDIAFGNNRKPERKPKSYLELVIGTLEDLTLRILIVSALISIIIETATADDDHRSIAWIEGIQFQNSYHHPIGFAILVAVMIVSNVTAANDYQKER